MIPLKMLIRSYSHTSLTIIYISVTKIFFLTNKDILMFLQIDFDRFVTPYGHNKVLSFPIFKIIFSSYEHAYYE